METSMMPPPKPPPARVDAVAVHLMHKPLDAMQQQQLKLQQHQQQIIRATAPMNHSLMPPPPMPYLPPLPLVPPSAGSLSPGSVSPASAASSYPFLFPASLPSVATAALLPGFSVAASSGRPPTGMRTLPVPNASAVPAAAAAPASYANSWFKRDSIDKIERRSLPEFFTRTQALPFKTEQVYLSLREWMMSRSERSPLVPLTATCCRRMLPGDAAAIVRLHSFLQHWGLINAHCMSNGLINAASSSSSKTHSPKDDHAPSRHKHQRTR